MGNRYTTKCNIYEINGGRRPLQLLMEMVGNVRRKRKLQKKIARLQGETRRSTGRNVIFGINALSIGGFTMSQIVYISCMLKRTWVSVLPVLC